MPALARRALVRLADDGHVEAKNIAAASALIAVATKQSVDAVSYWPDSLASVRHRRSALRRIAVVQ